VTFEQILKRFMRLCLFKWKLQKTHWSFSITITLRHHDVDLVESYILSRSPVCWLVPRQFRCDIKLYNCALCLASRQANEVTFSSAHVRRDVPCNVWITNYPLKLPQQLLANSIYCPPWWQTNVSRRKPQLLPKCHRNFAELLWPQFTATLASYWRLVVVTGPGYRRLAWPSDNRERGSPTAWPTDWRPADTGSWHRQPATTRPLPGWNVSTRGPSYRGRTDWQVFRHGDPRIHTSRLPWLWTCSWLWVVVWDGYGRVWSIPGGLRGLYGDFRMNVRLSGNCLNTG